MATNLEFIKSETATNVTSLSVTDCFSDRYDVYYCYLEFNRSATQANKLTFLNTSGTDSTADYEYATQQLNYGTGSTERRDTSETSILWITYDDVGTSGMYVYNPYDSSSYTFVTSQASGDTYGWKASAHHNSAETVAGLKWTFNGSGQYNHIKVSVYDRDWETKV